MEQREVCAEEQAVKEALAADTRFRFYRGMEIAVRPETRGIPKEVFQIYRTNGRFDLADAYILHAVYMLCHATPDMVMQWLKLERRHYPKKAVPNINPELLMKKVKILAHNGLLMLSDYITKDKREVVEICTCSLFGHTYFKNVLDTPYLPYDEDSFFHAEVECFKRMSAVAVTLAFASEDSCEKCGISGRILYGKRFNAEAFTYGYACMDFDGEKRIYIVEPVYFHVNSDVMSEEESLERVEERLRKVEKLVANIAKKEETATYTYDLLGRIRKETKTGSEDISYTYDSNNNRKEMKVGNKVTAYRYNENDELLRTDTLNTDTEEDSVVIYKNDRNGNQLATVNRYEIPSDKKDSTYIDIDVTLGDNRLNENVVNHYNAENQFTQTLTRNYKVSYTYDAEGLRTSKTVNGEKTVFVWDGDQLAMELSGSGKVQKRYIRGNDLVYADKGIENASGKVGISVLFDKYINAGKKSKVTSRSTTMPTPIGPRPQTQKKGFKITNKQLKKLGWIKSARSKISINNLNAALKKYKMNKVKIVRHFIAQCMYESNCGKSRSEADYLPDKAIRNYCARYDYRNDLGNNKKGDGYKFRGVGYIQVTGKNVIMKFAKEVSDNKIKKGGTTYIIKHGDKYLWRISCFWWDTHIPKRYFNGSKNVSADQISAKENYYDKPTFPKRKKNYDKCCKIIK